jgi:hypothetical protein
MSGLVVAPASGDRRIEKEAVCFDLNKAAR